MKAKPARALTRAIETGDHVAGKIDDLALGVNTKSRTRVVDYGHGPSRVERRRLDFVRRPGLGLDLDTEEDLSRAIAAGFDEERGFWMKDQRSRFLTGA